MVDGWRTIGFDDCHAGRMEVSICSRLAMNVGRAKWFRQTMDGSMGCRKMVDLAWCVQDGSLISSFCQADAEVERYNNTVRIVDAKRGRGTERRKKTKCSAGEFIIQVIVLSPSGRLTLRDDCRREDAPLALGRSIQS